MSESKKGERFVVLHTGVSLSPPDPPRTEEDLRKRREAGTWPPKQEDLFVEQGRVVDGDRLGDSKQRLLDLGAVRPAAEHEAKHARVSVGPGFLAAAHADLARKQAEIDRLRRQVGALQDRMAAVEALPAPAGAGAPEPDPALAARLAEMDRETAQLAQRAEFLDGELKRAHKERTDSAPEGVKAEPGEKYEGVLPPKPKASPSGQVEGEPAPAHGHAHEPAKRAK